jgi:hypothetical protein
MTKVIITSQFFERIVRLKNNSVSLTPIFYTQNLSKVQQSSLLLSLQEWAPSGASDGQNYVNVEGRGEVCARQLIYSSVYFFN